ncbi:hypothetical protein ACLQ24_06390, partial [Micromonospora sp. DT4]|uniref:hypothetical protein n=1 Tax=Micromonospora sp. DT4 TaxID=3393438 RepID=UPI003CEC611C
MAGRAQRRPIGRLGGRPVHRTRRGRGHDGSAGDRFAGTAGWRHGGDTAGLGATALARRRQGPTRGAVRRSRGSGTRGHGRPRAGLLGTRPDVTAGRLADPWRADGGARRSIRPGWTVRADARRDSGARRTVRAGPGRTRSGWTVRADIRSYRRAGRTLLIDAGWDNGAGRGVRTARRHSGTRRTLRTGPGRTIRTSTRRHRRTRHTILTGPGRTIRTSTRRHRRTRHTILTGPG